MFSMILNHKVVATASLSAIAALAGGLFAPSAQAINLVPQQEGEVKTSLGCLTDDCFELDSELFYSVESHEVEALGTASYLFVDQKGTTNNYETKGGTHFSFGSTDLGTTEPLYEHWFRPVAVDSDKNPIEGGELEVGSFTFTFKNVLSELNLSFFDTEDEGTSFDVYYADGSSYGETVVLAGKNKNIQDFTLYGVKKIKLNLGNADSSKFRHTGDGVNFQGTATVPEPSMMLGAIAAIVGGGMLRQRRQANADA